MIKKFTFGLLLLAGSLTMSAQTTSEYTGSEPINGEEYYLYNVETGLWIQGYTAIPGATRDRWNTAANVGSYGRPMKLEDMGDGTWKINTLAGDENLASNYGDGGLLYLDWGGNQAKWTLEGNAAEGYVIKSGDAVLGVSNDEHPLLINNGTNNIHWQLVSATERIEKMAEANAENPQDVSWLMINPELMNNDHRAGQWSVIREGGGEGWPDGFRPNRVFETWNYTNFEFYQTLNVPNGKYELTAHALFSPTEGFGTCKADYDDYVANGDATVNGYLYANAESVKLPSIYSFTSETPVADYAAKPLVDGGVSIVDGWWQAARAMAEDDKFKTETITVTVTDGNLRFGIKENNTSGISHWIIIGNFQLKYLGNAVDLQEYIENLQKAIDKAEAFDGNTTDVLSTALAEALAAAKQALTSTDPEVLTAATTALNNALIAANNVNDALLEETVALAKAEGVNTEAAEDFIANGTDGALVGKLLNDLRVERKIAHIETDNATYEGCTATEGDFYLLNVGRKAYLTNGSDWGAHAALGYPGLVSTLAANGEGYTIQFNELIPGDARDKYLGGSPYCDCANDGKDTYVFEPVEGKPGVYTIRGSRGYLAFDPNGEVDGGGILHYNTVTAMWSEPKNEDAHWMLVTKEQRLAQLENASSTTPVDASVIIKDASFNKYAALDNPWTELNQSFDWGWRDFGDKVTETYDSQEYCLAQGITAPKAGIYEVSVQAYYRDGKHDMHVAKLVNGEDLVEAPVVFADYEQAPLMYIHEEADKAPGEGDNTAIGNIPNSMYQASKFFENGLYWNRVRIEVTEDNAMLVIGIEKQGGNREGNWIVADNFRISYLGEKSGINSVEKNEVKGNNKIYNLQGIEVKEATIPGIYIQNGQKFIVK